MVLLMAKHEKHPQALTICCTANCNPLVISSTGLRVVRFPTSSTELPPKKKELTVDQSGFQSFLIPCYWVQIVKGAWRREFEALTPRFLAYHKCANCSMTYMGTHVLPIKARFFIWQGFKGCLVHLHRGKFSFKKSGILQLYFDLHYLDKAIPSP